MIKSVSAKAKLFLAIGSSFIALGIISNEWLLTKIFSPDGVIDSGSTRIAIWSFQVFSLIIGLSIIRYRTKIHFSSRAGINASLLAVALLISLISTEIALRVIGYQPWRITYANIKVNPGGKFFIPHRTLGYTHIPGHFTVTLRYGYSFTVTHLNNTLRITHPLTTYNSRHNKPEIWIFGGSFTHGWSINDDETYPWLLQESFPQYKVVNYGVGGYGTLHSIIQFREALDKGMKPKVVILAYGDYHDARNTFLRWRRKQVAPWNKLGHLKQPYARINSEGDLKYYMADVEYQEIPGMRRSALVHFLEQTYNKIEDIFYNSHEVSKAIITEFARLCKTRKIKFLLLGVNRQPLTTDMLKYGRASNVIVANIAVDKSKPENNNLPYDIHSSAIANMKYARKIEAILRRTIFRM